MICERIESGSNLPQMENRGCTPGSDRGILSSLVQMAPRPEPFFDSIGHERPPRADPRTFLARQVTTSFPTRLPQQRMVVGGLCRVRNDRSNSTITSEPGCKGHRDHDALGPALVAFSE
jgi:hypothetical protein